MKTFFVLDGRVKLTPWRREILHRIAFTEDIRFIRKRSFYRLHWDGYHLVPHLGNADVTYVLLRLRRNRLIQWPIDSDRVCVTLKGITALLECCDGRSS